MKKIFLSLCFIVGNLMPMFAEGGMRLLTTSFKHPELAKWAAENPVVLENFTRQDFVGIYDDSFYADVKTNADVLANNHGVLTLEFFKYIISESLVNSDSIFEFKVKNYVRKEINYNGAYIVFINSFKSGGGETFGFMENSAPAILPTDKVEAVDLHLRINNGYDQIKYERVNLSDFNEFFSKNYLFNTGIDNGGQIVYIDLNSDKNTGSIYLLNDNCNCKIGGKVKDFNVLKNNSEVLVENGYLKDFNEDKLRKLVVSQLNYLNYGDIKQIPLEIKEQVKDELLQLSVYLKSQDGKLIVKPQDKIKIIAVYSKTKFMITIGNIYVLRSGIVHESKHYWQWKHFKEKFGNTPIDKDLDWIEYDAYDYQLQDKTINDVPGFIKKNLEDYKTDFYNKSKTK